MLKHDKRSNLWIHLEEEAVKIKVRAIKNLFNEIIQENTPNLRKYMDAIGKQALRNLK